MNGYSTRIPGGQTRPKTGQGGPFWAQCPRWNREIAAMVGQYKDWTDGDVAAPISAVAKGAIETHFHRFASR
jgi:hypothetical protein